MTFFRSYSLWNSLPLLPSPVLHRDRTLQLFLLRLRHGREEIQPGRRLDGIDGDGEVLQRTVATIVGKDEADHLLRRSAVVHHLVIVRRYGDFVAADGGL